MLGNLLGDVRYARRSLWHNRGFAAAAIVTIALGVGVNTGADAVVVLSHELWTTRFSADPGVLGRTVELNRRLFTVVGIAAAGTFGGFI